MLSALGKTLAQMRDPSFRRVLLYSVACSLAVFLVLWILSWAGLAWAGGWLGDWMASQGYGEFWIGALTWLLAALAFTSIFFASFFLFPAFVSLAIGFFLEDIASAVEARHYPGLPPAREQPVLEMIADTLTFALITVAINLLALPIYLLLLFVPPLNLFVFYGLNGYLLGREFFELVAARRLDRPAAKRLRRQFRGKVFLAGVIIAFLLTIPLVNLIAPILATGLLLHLFEDLRKRTRSRAGDV